MSFYFNNSDPEATDAMLAIVHVSLDSEIPVIRVDVDLGSLPELHVDGYEVVVEFYAEKFNNEGVFFTDSNGLEMQKRVLNFRPTWDLVNTNYKDSLENITGNYYPINSALSLRD